MVEAGKVRSTASTLAGGAALGFDFDGIVGVVMALTPFDFYTSMTTLKKTMGRPESSCAPSGGRPPRGGGPGGAQSDHRVWQDVGRVSAGHAGRGGLPETDGD